MKVLRVFLTVFCFIFIVSAFQPVLAYGGGINTEEMPKVEQESFLESACINVFETEPEKREIISFDVNENGLIAIGTEINNNKCICVYSENMIFQYRISFICAGAFGFEWNGNDIEIYFVRSNANVIVDRQGNIKSVRSYLDDAEANDYFIHVLNVTERNINGAKYTLKTNSEKDVFLKPYSFPILSVSKTGEDEKILYDVSGKYSKTNALKTFGDVFLISFVLIILAVNFVKLYRNFKSKKAEKERRFQEMLRQANDNHRNQK